MATSISTPPESDVQIETKRVFIIDDHPIFRRGLVKLIESDDSLTLCGEASTASSALGALREHGCDVAVVDISLPGTDGLELVKHLRAEHPDLPLLVLSAHDEQLYALRALRAGATGYLMKRETDQTFMTAIHKVLAGGVYVSPTFGAQLIYKVARSQREGEGSPLEVLTDRELEILRLVGHGNSTRQIADSLHLSPKTVESHRLHIKDKLDLKSAADLVRFAVEFVAQEKGAGVG
jgi:DNA-binding NarL/FixJ family response regulator